MLNNFFDKILFFIGVIYFSFLIKIKKLVSREDEFFILRKFIKKNQNVIDVGANIGRYSFELSNIVGKKGLVYVFEPIQKSYLTLLTLIILNNVKNIIANATHNELFNKDGTEKRIFTDRILIFTISRMIKKEKNKLKKINSPSTSSKSIWTVRK